MRKLKIPKSKGNISNVTRRIETLPNPFGLFVTKVPGVKSCDFPQDGFKFHFIYFDPLGYVLALSHVTEKIILIHSVSPQKSNRVLYNHFDPLSKCSRSNFAPVLNESV